MDGIIALLASIARPGMESSIVWIALIAFISALAQIGFSLYGRSVKEKKVRHG